MKGSRKRHLSSFRYFCDRPCLPKTSFDSEDRPAQAVHNLRPGGNDQGDHRKRCVLRASCRCEAAAREMRPGRHCTCTPSRSASGHPTREMMMSNALSTELLQKMDAYWRAANYCTVGQIYLKDKPLLEAPLRLDHLKTRLLGNWGTTTGLNFIYVHLNRLIKQNDLDMAVLAWWPIPTWRVPIQRSIPKSTGAGTGCNGCPASSPGPTASRATWRPKPPGRSTRVANSATRWPTPMGPSPVIASGR